MSKRTESRRSLTQRLEAFVDRCVYTVNPRLGNQRFVARKRREIAESQIERFSTDREGRGGGAGGYRSSQRTPDAHNWLTSRLSPDSALEQDREEMCRRVDSAVKNYELGVAHVEGRVIRVAGCGLSLDPDVDFEEVEQDEQAVKDLNKQLRRGWERTACRIGKRGEHAWQIQHLCARYYERRREWFLLIGDEYDALAPTTLKVDVIHPDRVETPHGPGAVINSGEAPWIGDQYVRMGMQLDKSGRVVGCYVRDTHPGDDKLIKETFTYYPMVLPNGLPRMIHHFEITDEGQHRGCPRMQVGIKRLKNAEEYDEAELERNYVGACLAAIVSTDIPPEDMQASHGVETDSRGRKERDIVPGMIHYADDADSVTTMNPSGAPQSFDGYMEYQGRMFGAGAGTPYEMLTGNWRQLAYNAARIIWNMDEAAVDVLQLGHAQTWMAIYAHYVTRMVVSGEVEIDQVEFRSQPWAYCAARVIPPARASLDPSREDRNDLVLVESRIKEHGEMVERKTGMPRSKAYRRMRQNLDELQEWGLEVHLPNMGRDEEGNAGDNSSTMPGDKNQESSDANSEPVEAGAK